MLKHIYRLTVLFILISFSSAMAAEKTELFYSSPKEYTIGNITVTGIKHYEESVLIKISGLEVGDKISVPGDKVTNAIRKFWKHGLFSDVTISADSIANGNIYLNIALKEQPRLSHINYFGLKKNEIKDVDELINVVKGAQVTPHTLNNAELVIRNHFVKKGFHNTEVSIAQKDDISEENRVILDIDVDKKEKVKVNNLIIDGNNILSYHKINRYLKKTNEKGKIRNFFRTKKFITEQYSEDKSSLINKYNELGYRDAVIVIDSVYPSEEENTVDVYINIDEGIKYHFRDIKWLGNTQFTSLQLSQQLRIKKGDIYNFTRLTERLETDEDAVGNLYMDNGYLFYSLTPVEVNIEGDSIDLEMRISEGTKATINNVIITGNTKTNEQVVRRELRTKPGQLFDKSALIRSVRELANLGHFDPEKINPVPVPNPEDGSVDLRYGLEEKPNDQIELSGGWGAGMFVGTVGLSFNNFSMRNIFNKEAYHPLPSGDGQTLSLKAQTNGNYYQSYSMSFVEPWLGGKKPNSFSVSLYHSIMTDVSSSSGYGSYGSYGSSYGSSYGGYGYGYGTTNPDKFLKVTGISIGLGKRLNWPDDYFTLSNQINFQQYKVENWDFLGFANGSANSLSYKINFARNSIDQPIYTRRGGNFSLTSEFTFPYSMVDGIDYDDDDLPESDRYKWIEYHKWSFKGTRFTPITNNGKLVFMAKAEAGFLGYYNKNKKSPFEKYTLGGDGMSGYSLYGSETIGLRGYDNGSLTPYTSGTADGNIYNKMTLEIRYPLLLETSSTIFALAFLEGGNAWSEFENYSPFDIKRSAGIGIRIFLPMFGMMGVDWGYGFDDVSNDADASGSNFHFMIGQQF